MCYNVISITRRGLWLNLCLFSLVNFMQGKLEWLSFVTDCFNIIKPQPVNENPAHVEREWDYDLLASEKQSSSLTMWEPRESVGAKAELVRTVPIIWASYWYESKYTWVICSRSTLKQWPHQHTAGPTF